MYIIVRKVSHIHHFKLTRELRWLISFRMCEFDMLRRFEDREFLLEELWDCLWSRMVDRPLAICLIRSTSFFFDTDFYFVCLRFFRLLLAYLNIVCCICIFSANGRISTFLVNSAISWKDSLLFMRLVESLLNLLLRWPELEPLFVLLITWLPNFRWVLSASLKASLKYLLSSSAYRFAYS
jgi:hypothetical protein